MKKELIIFLNVDIISQLSLCVEVVHGHLFAEGISCCQFPVLNAVKLSSPPRDLESQTLLKKQKGSKDILGISCAGACLGKAVTAT